MCGSRRQMCSRRWIWAVAVSLALASCAGADDGESAQRPAADPVVIGFVNLEGAPTGSNPDLRAGSEVARKYINSELGGVDGRPLAFEICITNGSPESSTTCANQMVARKVVAVLGGVDLGSAASLPILTAAGIPYVGTTPLLPADLTTEGAFTLDPGGLGIAAHAAYAVDELGAEHVAVLHDDSPQGNQLAENFVRPVLVKRGLRPENIEMVAEKALAADLTPAVRAATEAGPDAVIVVFPPPSCSRIMQAVSALRVRAAMMYIGRCATPAAIEAGGVGAEGAYFFSSILNVEADAGNKDVRLYKAKAQRFGGPDLDVGSYETARGFATTMTFYQRLATLESSDITSASVAAAFSTAVDVPAFMSHPYTCDKRQAIPAFVSVCNAYVRIYRFVNGRYRTASDGWISAGAALTG